MNRSEPLRLKFVRNFTIEPVEFALKRELAADGLVAACTFGGFATAADEIAALGPTEPARLVVLALGLETSADDFGHASWAAQAACERHLMLLRSAVESSPVPVVVNTVLAPLFAADAPAAPGDRRHAESVDALNVEIRALARQHAGRVVLADWTSIARELGEAATYDYRFWFTGGAPFAAPFIGRYAAAIAGAVRALSGKARKCLVLDCDNTLWGGVLGEDGIDGIELAPDTLPGAYFRAFQRSVLDLHERGVTLALCSKNEEADVLEVLDRHPHSLIRREHVAAWRIGWNEKAASIAELARELNIGLDAMVFVDDSDFECELVRAAHPEVATLRTPDPGPSLLGFLPRLNLFDSLAVTREDRLRSRSYQQDRAREALSTTVGDIAAYKQRLGTRVVVRRAEAADVARVAQLVQRTNQFNLTTRRHDRIAIERMQGDPGWRVLCAEVSDRFGELGLVGVALVRLDGDDAIVDSMLMSCRALGRDAELAFAAEIFRDLAGVGTLRRIVAHYLPSAKNGLVADFWARAGLVPETDRGPVADEGFRFVSDGDLALLASRIMPAHVVATGA